jgi:hypothetical protein
MMTMDDYISKHSLTLWKKWPDYNANPHGLPGSDSGWVAAVFTDDGSKAPHLNEMFNIYANPERTRFVSVNTVTEKFRLVYSDLIPVMSEWLPMHSRYESQSFQ